jgi:hypothetical protein
LGPLLFLIFTLSINKCILKSIVKYFADDTKIFKIIQSVEDCSDLQSDLNNVVTWLADNGLSVNPKKSMVLRVGTSDTKFDYHIGDTIVAPVSVVKDLGVYVDSGLNFSHHCENLAVKCRRLCGMICKTFSSPTMRIKAFKTYVVPRLDYCSSVYSPFLLKDIDLLENVVSSFASRIFYRPNKFFRSSSSDSYTDRLRKMNLVSLESRRYEHDLLLCHKLYLKLVDLDFNNFFTISSNARLPAHAVPMSSYHSDNFRYSFVRRIRPAWNKIPHDIVTGSHSCFRNYIKDKIASNAYNNYLTSVVRRQGLTHV